VISCPKREMSYRVPGRANDGSVKGQRQLWLAWSATRIAVLTDWDDELPNVLWQAADGERPALQATKVTLTWPDKSEITFEIGDKERALVRSRNGRP